MNKVLATLVALAPLLLFACTSTESDYVSLFDADGTKVLQYRSAIAPETNPISLGNPVIFGRDQSDSTYFLTSASFIGRDSGQQVLVDDNRAGLIHIFDSVGNWVNSFGEKGQGPRQFGSYYVPHLVNNEILVWVGSNNRLIRFETDGRYIETITSPERIGLAPIPITGSNTGPYAIVKLLNNGPQPGQIDVSTEMTVLKLNSRLSQPISVFHEQRSNQAVWIAGGWLNPPYTTWSSPYAIAPDMPLAIGGVGTYQIRLLTFDNDQIVRIEIPEELIVIPQAVKELEIRKYRYWGLEEEARRNLQFPASYPVIRWMRWDELGRLWVESHSNDEIESDIRHYNVFAANGRWLFRQELPGRLANAYSDGVFITEFDSEGVSVVLYYPMTWK